MVDSVYYSTGTDWSIHEYVAVRWLWTAAPSVVAEAVGGSDSEYARIATLSGLPNVLGWSGHESQWRGGGREMGARQEDLERISAAELADYGADLWWLSPPWQPYSVRGRQHDLNDPRARSLAHILELLSDLPVERLPRHLALENVAGFARSQAREVLVSFLTAHGYQSRERQLCPTELGIPSRRPRYYLVASQVGPSRHFPWQTASL